ncbi:MAG: alpha/beta hydrolase [Acutalibacteraceae bacterium]
MNNLIFLYLCIVSIIAFALFVLSSIAAYYLFLIIIFSSSDKSFIFAAPHNKEKNASEKSKNQDTKYKKFFLENSTEKYIKSKDKLKLHSYILKNKIPSQNWVIMCHGYNGNGLRQVKLSKQFYKMGFNILIPDARGHGKSQGKYIGMGWLERKDILEWIKLILKFHPDAKIVLYGVSMGGATVMMTSGEALPKNVKCIIEDCGYTSVWDEFKYQFNTFFKVSCFPILHMTSFLTKITNHYSFPEASSINQIKKCKIPILFIHGSKDTFVPTYMVNELYESASCPKEILVIKGACHAESFFVNPKQYKRTVKNFLIKYNII